MTRPPAPRLGTLSRGGFPPAGPAVPRSTERQAPGGGDGGRAQGRWAPAARGGTHGASRPAEPGAGPGRGSRLQLGANFAAGRGVAGTPSGAGGGGGRGPSRLCARVSRHHAVQLPRPDPAGAVPQPAAAAAAAPRPGPASPPGPAAAAAPAAVPPVPRQVESADQEERHHRRLQGHHPGPGTGHQRESFADLQQEDPGEIRPKSRFGGRGRGGRAEGAPGHDPPALGRPRRTVAERDRADPALGPRSSGRAGPSVPGARGCQVRDRGGGRRGRSGPGRARRRVRVSGHLRGEWRRLGGLERTLPFWGLSGIQPSRDGWLRDHFC